jgi:hypothetical protein
MHGYGLMGKVLHRPHLSNFRRVGWTESSPTALLVKWAWPTTAGGAPLLPSASAFPQKIQGAPSATAAAASFSPSRLRPRARGVMGRPKGGAGEASKKPKSKLKQRGGVDFKVTTTPAVSWSERPTTPTLRRSEPLPNANGLRFWWFAEVQAQGRAEASAAQEHHQHGD